MSYLRQSIFDMAGYVPGFQPPDDEQWVKLNTNENPYPPAPGVARCLAEFDAGELLRYPDPQSTELVDALAAYHRLDAAR